jgi:hypothetical protein
MVCKICGAKRHGEWCVSCTLGNFGTEIDYSPFKTMLSRAKQRKKRFSLTLHDLYDQWQSQKGICPYTGWLLKLPKANEKLPKTPDRASLDRIDSSLGYTPDNIQFVSLAIQYAKHNWSQSDVRKMIFDAAIYLK